MRPFFLFVLYSLLLPFTYNKGLAQRISLEHPYNMLETFTSGAIPDSLELERELQKASKLYNNNRASSISILVILAEKALRYKCYTVAARSLLYLNGHFSQKGDYIKSLQYCRTALSLIPYHKDKTQIAMLYSALVGTWYSMGQFDSAAYYAYKATAIISQTKIANKSQAANISKAYRNVSLLCYKLNKPEISFFYIKQAEKIAKSYRDSEEIANIYAILGALYTAYFEVKKPKKLYRDSSIYYYSQARLYNKHNDISIASVIDDNMGRLWLIDGQPRRAIPLLESAILLSKQLHNKLNELTGSFALGRAYCDAGNYHAAEQILRNSIRSATQFHYKDMGSIVAAYLALSKTYAATGKYRLAYAMQNKSIPVIESIINAENDQTIYQLEKKASTAQKDKELVQRQMIIFKKNQQLQAKNVLIIGISISTIFLSILAFSFYRSKKHKQRFHQKQIYTLLQEQEIHNLRATISGEEKERTRIARELHDGVASQLTTLKFKLDYLRKTKDHSTKFQEEINEAYKQLDEATIELRKTAQNLIPDIIIENGLETALQFFCNKIHNSTGIKVAYEVFGNMPRLHNDIELSIYRMIQELIQNILKHANAHCIHIQLVYQNQLLSITIEDDGSGYVKHNSNKGYGIKNIEERVNTLNGHITINSNDNGTSIYIEFDIIMLLKNKEYAH